LKGYAVKLAVRDSRVSGRRRFGCRGLDSARRATREAQRTMRAAVWEEAVGNAVCDAVADFVAIPFVQVFVVEGFGIDEVNLGALRQRR